MRHETLALLIPIIAIIFGCSIAIIAVISSYKRKKHLFELHHQERMAAISKGMEIPPLPEALWADEPARARAPKETLRKGLVWLFVGVALYFAIPAFSHNDRMQMVALIPGAVGLANLVYYFTAGRHEPDPAVDKSETSPERAV